MNNISLVGRLGKDPDVRYFEDGKVVGKVSIAVRRWKDGADWFNLEVWGKQAQILADYCRKGDQIGVDGRMQQDSYNDRQTGEERKVWTVKVSNLHLLGKGGESGTGGTQRTAGTGGTSRTATAPANWDEEEVPF